MNLRDERPACASRSGAFALHVRWREAGASLRLLVPGGGDEVLVVLCGALERKKIVVAAARSGIAPAGGRARIVHSATPLLGIEEPAHPAKVLVRLAAHGVLVAPA